jgi:uncharacterized protein YkwD
LILSNHPRIAVRIRLGVLLLATGIVLAASAALRTASGLAGRPGCNGARGLPGHVGIGHMRQATLCLINHIRARHGLGPLHSVVSLRKAAQHHSGDMVRRNYFSHDTPGGGTIQSRIGGSGYLAGAHRYLYGEIIGGGTASLGSPKAVMRAWMHSGTHRSEILNRAFHDLGVGVARGFPGRGHSGATFTVDFGSRH